MYQENLNKSEIALNFCKAAQVWSFLIQIDYFGTYHVESMKKSRNLYFHMAGGGVVFYNK